MNKFFCYKYQSLSLFVQNMMVHPGGKKQEESDLESVSNDPIHTKVKQLLKATAKCK